MKNMPSEAVEARKEAGDDTIVTEAMITEATTVRQLTSFDSKNSVVLVPLNHYI